GRNGHHVKNTTSFGNPSRQQNYRQSHIYHPLGTTTPSISFLNWMLHRGTSNNLVHHRSEDASTQHASKQAAAEPPTAVLMTSVSPTASAAPATAVLPKNAVPPTATVLPNAADGVLPAFIGNETLRFSTVNRGCPQLGGLDVPHEKHCRLQHKPCAPHMRHIHQYNSFYWKYVYENDQGGEGNCQWDAQYGYGRKIVVTYAEGSSRWQLAQRLKESCGNFGIDTFIIHNRQTTKEAGIAFLEDWMDKFPTGIGNWVWKPFLLRFELDRAGPNDVLFWVDSDSVFIQDPTNYFCAAKARSVIIFENGIMDVETTKRDTMISLGGDTLDFAYTNTAVAGYMLVSNDHFGRQFLDIWSSAAVPTAWVRTQAPSTLGTDYFEFSGNPIPYNHQSDQSVVSIVAKLMGLKTYASPTPDTWGLLPEVVLRNRKQAGLPMHDVIRHNHGCDFGLPFWNSELNSTCSYDQWLQAKGI
ncbi:predicted protein, partial [Micromonas commoda]